MFPLGGIGFSYQADCRLEIRKDAGSKAVHVYRIKGMDVTYDFYIQRNLEHRPFPSLLLPTRTIQHNI